MTPSDAKRHALLTGMAAHVLAHGLNGSSLRTLANAAGVSDRMLLYYFEDKSAILSATLNHLTDELMMALEIATASESIDADALIVRIGTVLLTPQLWPYARLWLELGAQAGFGDPLCRKVGREITDKLLNWGAKQLDSDIAGTVPHLAKLHGAMMFNAIGMPDKALEALQPHP